MYLYQMFGFQLEMGSAQVILHAMVESGGLFLSSLAGQFIMGKIKYKYT